MRLKESHKWVQNQNRMLEEKSLKSASNYVHVGDMILVNLAKAGRQQKQIFACRQTDRRQKTSEVCHILCFTD